MMKKKGFGREHGSTVSRLTCISTFHLLWLGQSRHACLSGAGSVDMPQLQHRVCVPLLDHSKMLTSFCFVYFLLHLLLLLLLSSSFFLFFLFQVQVPLEVRLVRAHLRPALKQHQASHAALRPLHRGPAAHAEAQGRRHSSPCMLPSPPTRSKPPKIKEEKRGKRKKRKKKQKKGKRELKAT